jgi:hypothetical protein
MVPEKGVWHRQKECGISIDLPYVPVYLLFKAVEQKIEEY